jgi:hypothetical protein
MIKRMLILRGNAAKQGTYPDENGSKIAWPKGALHVHAATEYAKSKGYEPAVLDVPGFPQGQKSAQVKAALKQFFEDMGITAFYGFSGGGYNLRHILEYLVSNKPEALRRIDLIVVLGAPEQPRSKFEASRYNKVAMSKVHPGHWEPVKWELVYGTNPPKSALPPGLPNGLDTHMFGPDVLLAGGWAGVA